VREARALAGGTPALPNKERAGERE